MRNILITVMMLIAVSLMFVGIIASDTTGVKAKIEEKGNIANTQISQLDTD